MQTKLETMPAIIQQLRSEISRLKVELSDLDRQRSKLVAPLDLHINDIERRLRAAERMLASYTGAATEAGTLPTRLSRRKRGYQGPSSNREVALAATINLTWMDVERVAIPSSLKGRALRSNSKRAKIIRATKALLSAGGPRSRSEIIKFIESLGLMGKEKNPKAYLSVVLSYAKEIFASNGVVWYLKETSEAARASDSSNMDRLGDSAGLN